MLLAPRALESPFWAKVQELREAVVDFKTSGKPVYAFLEYGGDREYYLATAADKVFLLPTATLDLTGVATYEVFLRGTLDWAGAYPDLLHIGDYKTAINIFTEKTFTPAHKEMSTALNRDQFDQLVRGIADGRHKSEGEVRTAIDEGPLLPEDALRHGLVDDLAYEDELDDLVQEVGDPGELTLLESDDYSGVSWESLGVRRRSRIAVLHAVGAITLGRSGYDPVNGPVVGSDSLVEYIRRIRADPSIRAIVVRIDSPGGASTASDVIWRELTITKNDPHKRPIVVSMSDLAASGGYYIAMAGDVLVAQPGTLTGSIGIYTGKFVTGGTFDKFGANIEATSEGRHAEIYSPDRRFTDEERAKVLESMQVVLRPVRRESRRGATDLAGEDRPDCAGPGVDRAAGAPGGPGRSARRLTDRHRGGQAARPHRRRGRSRAGDLSAAPQRVRAAQRAVRSVGGAEHRRSDRHAARAARPPHPGCAARAVPPVPLRRDPRAHALRVPALSRTRRRAVAAAQRAAAGARGEAGEVPTARASVSWLMAMASDSLALTM